MLTGCASKSHWQLDAVDALLIYDMQQSNIDGAWRMGEMLQAFVRGNQQSQLTMPCYVLKVITRSV